MTAQALAPARLSFLLRLCPPLIKCALYRHWQRHACLTKGAGVFPLCYHLSGAAGLINTPLLFALGRSWGDCGGEV